MSPVRMHTEHSFFFFFFNDSRPRTVISRKQHVVQGIFVTFFRVLLTLFIPHSDKENPPRGKFEHLYCNCIATTMASEAPLKH